MITQIFFGCCMVALTVAFHAVCLDRLMLLLETIGPKTFSIFKKNWKIPMMVCTVLFVFLSHIIQIWLWASLLYHLEPTILDSFEKALYFTTSTFTTVGYGDVYLDEKWRLLGSFAAANGFILFGWSTAFVFEIISKLYKNEKIR